MTLPGNVIMMRRHNSTPHDVATSPYYIGTTSPMQANRIGPIENGKPKKSWGERLKLGGSTKADKPIRDDERRQHQQQQEVAHNNYLVQEYRNKYGTLSDGSALSKSMKYAETWLYGSVRQPSPSHPLLYQQPPSMSVLPAELSRNTFSPSHIPHITMCSCPEFIGGTTRSKKNTSSSGICKKCGGSRMPWRGGGTLRAGTVRMTSDVSRMGGTVRVTSNRVRPSLMNVAPNMKSFAPDPYDLMRRNRLAVPSNDDEDGKRGRRAKSSSPGRHNIRRSPSPPVPRTKEARRARRDMSWESEDLVVAMESPDNKRKSILECDVNPYRLISKHLKNGDENEEPDRDENDIDDDDEMSDDMSDNALEDVKVEVLGTAERKTKTLEVEKCSQKGVTIGGQRMKVFASAPSIGNEADYVADEIEDAKRPASMIPRFQSPKRPQRRVKSLDGLATVKSTTLVVRNGDDETESGKGDTTTTTSSSNSQIERRSNLISSNIKSILKKPSSSPLVAAGCTGDRTVSSSQQLPSSSPMTFSDTIQEPDCAAVVQSDSKARTNITTTTTTTPTTPTTTANVRASTPISCSPTTIQDKRENRKKKQVQFDDSVTSNVTGLDTSASEVKQGDVDRDGDEVIEVRFKVSEPKLKFFGEAVRDKDADNVIGVDDTDICEGVVVERMPPTVGRMWANQLLIPDVSEMPSRDPNSVVTLRRSLSDRQMTPGEDSIGLTKQEQTAAMFNDTMRLRIMSGRRTDSRQAFSHPGSTLDISSRTRRVLSPSRPKEPPPPPPLPAPTQKAAAKTETAKTQSEEENVMKSKLVDVEREKPKLKLLVMPDEVAKCEPQKKESLQVPQIRPPKVLLENHQEIRFINSEIAPPPQLPPRHIFPFTKKQIQNINNQKRHNSLQISPSSTLIRGNTRNKSRPNSCIPQIVGHPSDAGLVHVASRIRHRNSDPGPAMSGVNLRLVEPAGDVSDGVRTVVSVCPDSPDIHRLQIKTDAPPSRRTSIMINGDDHEINTHSTSVIIDEKDRNVNKVTISVGGVDTSWNTFIDTSPNSSLSRFNHSNQITIPVSPEPVYNQRSNVQVDDQSVVIVDRTTGKSLGTQHEYEVLEMLMDPVEAVRRHMVPHVCGKSNPDGGANLVSASAMERLNSLLVDQKSCSESDASAVEVSSPESSMSDVKYSSSGGNMSENGNEQDYNGISVHYFSAPRFLIGDQADDDKNDDVQMNAADVYDDAENIYESIKDPIYEEIGFPDTPPPLPLSPPPSLDDLDDKRTSRSIFEGASKYDILNYLVDAKERGYVESDYNSSNCEEALLDALNGKSVDLSIGELSSRISNLSNVSDSSEDNMAIISAITKDEVVRKSSADIERNDSGVGSETSKSSRSRWQTIPAGVIREDQTHLCEDCDVVVDTQVTDSGVMFAPLVCRKCSKKRAERKDTITEIVETEEKYGGDLRIILEEFYRPMLVAGLLTSEQLSAIFLNVEELLENSAVLAEKLRDAHDIAIEQGDEDLLTVNVGSIFLEAAPMLHAFESYCTRQGGASLLLANLEKEKELLRIFLRVSQMENAVLRRMNLNSFLMVPVQRVTKYPLLLARLHKVTPAHHAGRELLKQAQHKIELHLEHMNSVAKDFSSTKLWRRISIVNGRRSSSEIDMINIKLRKMAVDVLEWNHDEVKFAMEGRMLYTNPTDNNWRKGRTIKLNPINALLVTNGKQTEDYRPEDELLLFPRKTGVKEATLLLVKEKCGRYSLLRDPLYLDKCIVCCETDWEDYIEVQELASKDTFIFKAEDSERTKLWYRQLQYHSQGLGAWRRRRNALANIMINGMMTRS